MFRRCIASHVATLLSISVLVSGLASARAASRDDEEVSANADYVVVSRKVATADLNLASPDDQRRLRQRLDVAARRACLDAGGVTAIQDDSLRRCYETATRDAWASVQDRILVAAARSHVIANVQTGAPVRSQEIASSRSR